MKYSIYVCEKIIQINTISDCFKRHLQGYLIKEPAPEPDYVIDITKESFKNPNIEGGNYFDSSVEETVILKRLAKIFLLDRKIVTVHGVAVAYKNAAYLFTAPSGVGKTTHANLWLDNLADAYILNGDKPFLEVGDTIVAWGSPWCGKERDSKNKSEELKAICILERSEENSIMEISFEQAFPLLLKQTGVPDIKNALHQVVYILREFRGKVKFFLFKVNNFKEDAFVTSFEELIKI